ncbi:hydantoinase B/oxoprolinase family protein [Pelagicoccus sp. SDUM812003]|uniref:hydantoinase B/oxoprolinase family protein n=1 Tax=Pelagicoccus sp. SDUM812003 TaxID=3041267 RepID=UPI002810096F|nr:hydantoinase B/oxoprolinase family protein [Pelagicoccus sp. SDUM812003]MDQ8203405.1 hydantoinase B/oxoprolinase family protein [Pelagicoccus sp. SDUM812003]
MWKFWIDTGGTFTDCIALTPEGERRRAKVLSSSCLRASLVSKLSDDEVEVDIAQELPDDFFRGYTFRVLSRQPFESAVVKWDADRGVAKLDRVLPEVQKGQLCEFQSPEEPPTLAARLITGTSLDDALPPLDMRLATTRGTNALLERKGAKVGLFVTRGFRDLLKIGNQQRPDLFELGIQKPDPLTERVYEVDERLDRNGEALKPLDEVALAELIAEAKRNGVEAFAVALMHSYRNDVHEKRIREMLTEEGCRYVSLSSELSPYVKLLPRTETTVVDTYLAPIMEAYLDAVEEAMERGERAGEEREPGGLALSTLRVMTSAGGLVGRKQFRPKDSLLSGPAGGVVGSSSVGLAAGRPKTIAFDMGGTSTDVSRFDGQLDYQFEQRIGAARVYAPSLRIETVAAGGGSICWFDGTALRVGPESAGASPGPACYGAGGPLAVTDVNLLLGRLDASRFGIPVFEEAARERLRDLQEQIEKALGKRIGEDELLQGFLEIANERMAEAIRKISVGAGYDPAGFAMVAFGGAGGLHACSVANRLGMDTVLFPADAGLLSAYGLERAKLEQFAGRQVLRPFSEVVDLIENWVADLGSEASDKLRRDGLAESEVELLPARYELRFAGQESILVVEGGPAESIAQRFEAAYEDRFGFLPTGLAVELVAIRVIGRGGASDAIDERFETGEDVSRDRSRFFIDRADLSVGDRLEGPLVIQDPYSTVFVDTGWVTEVGSLGTLRLRKVSAGGETGRQLDEVVDLELFTNRFLALVDEMGALLERVAFSTNVKDRKDFSCALLDAEGYLVANAPHIPVHLGALGVCVRTVVETMDLGPEDVVVTNHPAFGGAHLPDVTLIAPVYSKHGSRRIGYVANRAHHAEIGGISPGSMPPNAENLAQEGVVISPFKLIDGGRANWDDLKRLLSEGDYPSRSLDENVADLSAQLASIRRGQAALRELARSEGEERVDRFMGLLKKRAATALRRAMEQSGEFGKNKGEENAPWTSRSTRERLDNGAEVCVTVSRQASGKWMIDFEGSAGVQASNYNATPAIVTSAVIYTLRLLAAEDIPLNEGFLDVVDIRIPEGMLNPTFHQDANRCPAVVAGNVEVSQLVVSTLIKAFGLAACSQSTMNNLIFGTSRFGYYETIAGGEGGTPQRDGASGVHTHMTNTAMTDPELMELRYPVRLEAFHLRDGSGGIGARRGGDGVVKCIRFLEPVTLSLLTQRRERPPFGMAGGEPGSCGRQALLKPDGSEERLPGNGSFELAADSVLLVETPGGGAWGEGNDE